MDKNTQDSATTQRDGMSKWLATPEAKTAIEKSREQKKKVEAVTIQMSIIKQEELSKPFTV